jgi:carnitine O-acetyltransferase
MSTAEPPTPDDPALPRVPLPSLESTARRLLEWCAPLLTAGQRHETEQALEAFLAPESPARRLHDALTAYEREPGICSWLDEFWRDRYLGRRDRIALNANFFFLFRDSGEPQATRAASLISGVLAYKRAIDAGELPPRTQRGRLLSTVQNGFLFSATRIPGRDRDSSRSPNTAGWPGPSTERHIVVCRNGRMFAMTVLGPDGAPHLHAELERGLQEIVALAEARPDAGEQVGQLTTTARAAWAASRAALLALDPANGLALDVVERALFLVCLDDVTPAGAHEAGDHLLHGDSANRWFDKALSLIVLADGTAGLNGEHCNLDGTTMTDLIDAVCTATPAEHERRSGARAHGRPQITPIRFVLDDALRADIRAAGADFAQFAAANASTALAVDDVGAEAIKARGVSPDAFVQMSIQLAHRRVRGVVGATYESISMRHYRCGRTEAMRVVSPESVEFVAVMDDPAADDATRAAALRAAAAKHVARARECQAGAAPEQHLWELALLQRRHGAALGAEGPLALYDSPGWRIMRDDYLSTSSVPSVNVEYFGFGATGAHCIGVGYTLAAGRLHAYISAPRSGVDAMRRFAESLPVVMRELLALLDAAR